MATLTIYGEYDGYIRSESTGTYPANYAVARAGNNLQAIAGIKVGQYGSSPDPFSPDVIDECYEAFISFDTSTVVNPTGATLILWCFGFMFTDGALSNEVWVRDWGTAPVTTSDWLSGGDLQIGDGVGAKVATWTRRGLGSGAREASFINIGTELLDSLNLAGSSRYMIADSAFRTGTPPTGHSAGSPYEENDTFGSVATAGTTQDPKLVITYTAPANIKTISAAGGNWNSAATWNEGSIPTSADNVVATPSSGNLTINVAAACRSIDLTGYTGILTHNGFTLSVGDAIGGKFKFSPEMTYAPVTAVTPTAIVKFVATSDNGGAGWPITMSGKSFQQVEFDGVGGKWTFQDTFRAINTGSGGGPA